MGAPGVWVRRGGGVNQGATLPRGAIQNGLTASCGAVQVKEGSRA